MKNIQIAIWAEYMKIHKSKILLITAIIFAVIPVMVALMMFVSRNPEIADKLGMIGTKAKLFAENDWEGYLRLLLQAMTSIGLIGFGFVTTWVFGREHTERTMKDLLALPVTRSSIVLAKFVIVFIWCILLTLIFFIFGLILGNFLSLPAWSPQLFQQFSDSFFITSLLTLFLCSPVAFIAGYSRGIIAPIGFVILTMILAQFIAVVGLGPFFPWAIPGIYSVSQESEGFHLTVVSYAMLVSTFFIAYWATVNWWKTADHH